MTFALVPLGLPLALHAAPAEHGRHVRAAADCAAAPRIALPNAHIDAEAHIVALLLDHWNGRFLMGGGGGYAGSVDNQYASTCAV
jgi:hypothetical protein